MINDPTTRDKALVDWVRQKMAGENPPVPQPTRAPADPVDRDARLVEFVRSQLRREGYDEWGCPLAPEQQAHPPEVEGGSQADALTTEEYAAWLLMTDEAQQAAVDGDQAAQNLWSALTGALEDGLTPARAVEAVAAEAARAGVELAVVEGDEEEDESEEAD